MYSDMSCLMYQPYASYFPYQRAGASGSPYQDPIKKFHASLDKVHDSLHSSTNYSNSLGLPTYTHTSAPATATSATSHHHTNHPLLTGIGVSSGGNNGGLGLNNPGTPSSTILTKQEPQLEDKDQLPPTPKDTQFISSNCVIFSYTNGDTSSNVDEHFTRALNQPSSFNNLTDSSGGQSNKSSPSWKGNDTPPIPMSQRNFPASFWNSNYQPPPTNTLASLGHSVDPYSHMASSLHSMSSFAAAAQDPWSRYPFSNHPHQSHSYGHHHHPSLHDLSSYSSMSAASNRFNSQFSSLMPSAAAAAGKLSTLTGQYDLHTHSKHSSDPWATSSRYHHHTDPFSASTSHHQDPYGLYGGALSGAC